MATRISTSAANLAFKADLEKVHLWLSNEVKNFWGYKAEIIVDRLIQQITNSILSTYAESVYLASIEGAVKPPDQSSKCIKAKNVGIRFDTGSVDISVKQWIFAQGLFFVHWCACLVSICFPNIEKPVERKNVTLAYGIGDGVLFKDGSDKDFTNYVENIPPNPIAQSDEVWFESTIADVDSTNRKWRYARWPLLSFLRNAEIGSVGRMAMVFALTKDGLSYLLLSIKYPYLALLCKDIPYGSIVRKLDKARRLKSIVLTCSNFRSQPLWMRGLKHCTTHMIWYSQNWMPIVRKSDGVNSDNPYLPWIRVKSHLVWTSVFGEYLSGITKCSEIVTMGPLVWQTLKLGQPPSDSFVITVFDVPPFGDMVALEEEGNVCNYYCYENIRKFLVDLIEISRSQALSMHSRKIQLRLKPKRDYSNGYSSKYYTDLKAYQDNGDLILLDAGENLGAVISGSHLVVAIPFTSPVYIADMFGVPSIFYDPTCEIVEQNFADEPTLIQFASGKDHLNMKIFNLMSKQIEGAIH